MRKLETCGKELGRWEKSVFGNVRVELNRLKQVLAKEERAAMVSGNNFWVRKIKKDRVNYIIGPYPLYYISIWSSIVSI